MIKVFKLKHRKPEEVLDKVHRARIIGFMFNWNFSVDAKQNTITFTVHYGGGMKEEEEKKMIRELEAYVRSIDVES